MQVIAVPAKVVRQEEVAKVTGHTTDLLELLGGCCKVQPACSGCDRSPLQHCPAQLKLQLAA